MLWVLKDFSSTRPISVRGPSRGSGGGSFRRCRNHLSWVPLALLGDSLYVKRPINGCRVALQPPRGTKSQRCATHTLKGFIFPIGRKSHSAGCDNTHSNTCSPCAGARGPPPETLRLSSMQAGSRPAHHDRRPAVGSHAHAHHFASRRHALSDQSPINACLLCRLIPNGYVPIRVQTGPCF